ncbi:MAG: sigma 54-interacting transcriptional regulator [Candidatus Brocadiae bacterium]|nr:sigma 54-interacting transcriptional regulator [Candidatus Brocadiia bacterium]
MADIGDLLQQEGFLHTLFQAIPCGVIVVDEALRAQSINEVAQRTFALEASAGIGQLPGKVLRCAHVEDSPEGCGHGAMCEACDVRAVAQSALNGAEVRRQRTRRRVVMDGRTEELNFLVSAAPVTYGGKRFAIVVLEDITEVSHLRRRLRAEQSFAGIVGRDPKMLDVFDTIGELAEVSAPVLILGESGTGKELVAAAIHNEGPRSGKLFVPVNCSALPESLLESELFGHVRGAFTGAIRDKKGRFELANGGTIFLDEVGDIPGSIQVKLLRVLQEGTFERVGGEETVRVDARVISATNRDLRAEADAGRFRDDLFYRLCVVPVTMPPLRDRRNDIPLLAEYILCQALEDAGRADVFLAPETLGLLMDHDWPGNVRELQNAIQYALIKCHGGNLLPEHLPATVAHGDGVPRASRRRRRRKLAAPAVRRALEEAKGNKVLAARNLGVSRATLYRFLDEMGG